MLSVAEKNAMLDARYGSGTPATRYFALFDGDPSDGGTEVSGNNYSRVAVTNNATNFPNASNGVKTNGTDIEFPTPSGAWGSVSYAAEFDAATDGNLVSWDELPVTRSPVSGDPVSIPAGQFTVTLSDPA